MKLGPFLAGIALLAVAIVPIALGAVAVRVRWFAGWRGARARVVEAVVALAALTATGQVLGIAGVLERWTVIVGGIVAGAVMLGVARRGSPRGVAESPEPEAATSAMPRIALIAIALSAGVVAWQYLAQTIAALREGMQYTIDTLWYHGPMAARFAQEGSILGIQYFDDDPLTAFFPGGSALLHSIGIVVVGDDVLSPALNLGFLALALVAAWVIGRAFGAGPLAVLAVVVALGTPTMVATQPGGAYNDVIGLALVLSAGALLVHGRGDTAALVVGGLAAGMAIGMKFTMLPLVAALSIGVLLAAGRGARVRAALAWLAPMAAIAGVWYVRNLVKADNPLPGLSLHLGPLSLPELNTVGPTESVLGKLGDWEHVKDAYVSGLQDVFGPPAWALVVAAVVGAGTVVIRRGDAWLRALAFAVPVSVLAFVVQPQYSTFPHNFRYLGPALAIGLLLLPATPWFRSPGARLWLLGGLVVALLAIEIDANDLWPNGRDVAAAAVVLLVLGALGAICLLRGLPTGRGAVASAGVIVLVVVAAFFVAQRDYRDNRATFASLGSAENVLAPLRDVTDSRIATVGLYLQYPLYGRDLSNHVQYLGETGEHGARAPFTKCGAFKRAINEGRYEYLVVAKQNYPVGVANARSRELEWAKADPTLRFLGSDGDNAAVYAIDTPLDPATCPDP